MVFYNLHAMSGTEVLVFAMIKGTIEYSFF
jgi:hypothetical protein